MVTTPLITYDEAIGQLRASGLDEVQDIAAKMSAATAIVIGYIKRPDHGWTATTVPDEVKAAILMQLVELYRFRGDDDDTEPSDGHLAPRIRRALQGYRDPTLA